MHKLQIDPKHAREPTRDHPSHHPKELCEAQETKFHPHKPGGENGNLFFVGSATTIIEWAGIRIMTDPNFLSFGDCIDLGHGVRATRVTDPAIGMHEMPPIHLVLLSHYQAAHFDKDVENSFRRDMPIITTHYAKSHLESKGDDSFTQVYPLDQYQTMVVDIKSTDSSATKKSAIRITGMPGKHIPPGPLSRVNDVLKAVPPVTGWMVELGHTIQYGNEDEDFETGYRIYISGDTLMCDELREIPELYDGSRIDLMLIHLGRTTIPSPSVPLLMVTMDAEQGVELLKLMEPDVTIPIHYDDYSVFLEPLSEFKEAVDEARLSHKVVYLDRKDQYKFRVR